jgi:protein gp37
MSTKIEWTDNTWNPIIGCSKLSDGCKNCYAVTMANRLSHNPSTPQYTGLTRSATTWSGETRLVESELTKPLKWQRGRRIFVCSMSDLFHDATPDEWIDRVFAVAALCPQHTFQILSKRPKRMLEYFTKPHRPGQFLTVLDGGEIIDTPSASVRAHSAMCDLLPTVPADALNRAVRLIDERDGEGDGFIRRWPLPNVWLGATVENQEAANERIPLLLKTPAAKRFISVEPMLGPVDLNGIDVDGDHVMDALKSISWCESWERDWSPEATGVPFEEAREYYIDEGGVWPPTDERGACLDWVIVGAETGPKKRLMDPAWALDLRDQCASAGVPFFFKKDSDGRRELDGEVWEQFPGAVKIAAE